MTEKTSLIDNSRLLDPTSQPIIMNQDVLDQPQAPRTISFFKYYTFITGFDKFLLVGGTLAAILAGGILPSISLVMGHVAAAFTPTEGSDTNPNILSTMSTIAAIVMMIALVLFFFSYVFYAFYQHLAENICLDLRKRYISALMRQEVGYFEVNKVEQIPAQISEIFDTVKSSIGEKIATLIFACSTCISGMIYALCFGPVYAAVCIAYLPALITILAVFGRMVQKSSLQKLEVVKQLGGVCEETLTAIKVVAGFTREEHELVKFERYSSETMAVSKRASATMALMVGLMKFTIFFFYTYSLFCGSFFIQTAYPNVAKNNEPYNQQIVIQVLIALITGFIGLIAALPNVQALVSAKTLGVLIFDVIERVPEVRNDPNSISQLRLEKEISFKNVTFKYPTSMPEHQPVLIDASFVIKAGCTTAIVGPSGSGKSTIVQLVERFYDPREGGQILFDSQNIKRIDLKTLRESIGYVGQEPVMIMGTIRDNLLYGNKDATEPDMLHALSQANAQFVLEQESGLDTFVGTAGIMNMSGGQKQRIAIARALIKKPKILILDEATSALDPKSEGEVQVAIDQIAKSGSKLTILIIAHRLTTIASADNLLYFQSRSQLVSAAKGTPEYDTIFEKLKSISYAAGDDAPEDEEENLSDNEEYENQALPIIDEDDDENRVEGTMVQDENLTLKRNMVSINDDDGYNPQLLQEDQRASVRSFSEFGVSLQYRPSELNNEEQKIVQNTYQNQGQNKLSPLDTNLMSQPKTAQNLNNLFVNQTPKNPSQKPTTPLKNFRTFSAKSDTRVKNQQYRTKSDAMSRQSSIMSIQDIDGVIPMESEDSKVNFREITYGEIMKYYSPINYAVFGFCASVVASLNLPLFGLVLSKFIFLLAEPTTTPQELTHFSNERYFWTSMFALLCVGIGTSSYCQKLCFGIGGENLTQTLRVKLFESILRKNIGWFDSKNRAPGILTNIIIEDINSINGLTTEYFGIVVEAALGLFFSCLICFIFSWRLAIVVTLTSPLMVLGGLGISKLQFNQKAVDDSYNQANALLSDIIINYRTVISFGDKNMQFILKRYGELLIVPHQAGIKRAHISGLFFGYSQSIRFAFIAFVFYVAAIVVQRYDANPEAVFTGCYVVFVGAIGSGVSISQLPSISKAKASAKTVFGIIEEPSEIDPKQTGSRKAPSGAVEFRNLSFRYPSRKKYVLRNFNLRIEPNQSVAIVGHSGSGKSTIASLLLRFYDCQKGQLLIDDINIKDYDLEKLRNHLSIVQQEPLLFNETIKQNILFGDLNASDARVKEVAIQSNALGFILQNDEDLSSLSVQNRILGDYQRIFNEQIDKSKYRYLNGLQDLIRDRILDYQQLKFLCQMLPYMSNIGIDQLERNVEDLIASLKQQTAKQDCTWQMILQGADFQPEIKKVNSYLSTVQLSEEHRAEIVEACNKNQGEFDLQTVQAYVESPKKPKFAVYLKQDRARVEEYFKARFQSFVNQVKVKAMEKELDPGFGKMCGLKGGKLSGGQKQRIAIARALIKNPRIMILDEATSALDEQSQEIVQQALDRSMEGRTSVVIAHRMSTIKKCNRIVVVHKGKVVEDGTYEELSLKPGGHFARLEAGIA